VWSVRVTVDLPYLWTYRLWQVILDEPIRCLRDWALGLPVPRYTGGHANNHWMETQHTYALELETQRVWDYAGDK